MQPDATNYNSNQRKNNVKEASERVPDLDCNSTVDVSLPVAVYNSVV